MFVVLKVGELACSTVIDRHLGQRFTPIFTSLPVIYVYQESQNCIKFIGIIIYNFILRAQRFKL